MSSRLRSCPYFLPHKELRECVYCDKAKHIKLKGVLPTKIRNKSKNCSRIEYFNNAIREYINYSFFQSTSFLTEFPRGNNDEQ